MDSRQPLTDDAAVFGIEGDDDALAADGVRERLKQCVLMPSAVNAAVPTITLVRALVDAALCARSAVRTPPPTRHDGAWRASSLDESVVRAPADGGVEVDDLDLGEGREALEHLQRRVAFERLLAALDELDDFAVHQIDAGNDHAVLLHGDAVPYRGIP